jgi:two-component system NtrC family sensor kinase
MELPENRRVLVIDDNESIHADFRKIIGKDAKQEAALDAAAAALFGDAPTVSEQIGFDVDCAQQGQEGLAYVERAIAEGRPYALAFVDVRMPPGWDGIETIRHMWQVDANLQVVICTAYSDYSWSEMMHVLGETDRLLILKKPFDNIEVRQITSALVSKWNLTREANRTMQDLHEMVRERTFELNASNQRLLLEIAERKRSEEALREAETRTRVILDTAPDGIITIDQAGTIESCNGAAENMFGYSPNELAGKNITVLMPAFEAQVDSCLRADKLDNASVLTTHRPMHGLRRGGDRFPVEVGWSELRINDRTHFTAIVRDMTEQKVLEAQLIQAQKLESIGQLAAGIAHEINTPTQYVAHNTYFLKDAFHDLTHLLDQFDGLLEAAKRDEISEELLNQVDAEIKAADMAYLRDEIPKVIDQSLEGVQRVAAIVGAVREFSHPGKGAKVAVDLNRTIASTVTVARNEWSPVAEVKLELDPQLPPVPCFAAEFNQVILNLIVNAAHAIEEGQHQGSNEKGQITVRTRHNHDWAEIQISDSGMGIAPENFTKIFDPFFTTKQVGKGTGQGLSIARTIVVKKHEGELNFESERGKGTTFTIRLPLAQLAEK